MRHATLEAVGRKSARKRGGGASWTAQALFARTRTHGEPRRSGKCGYVDAGLLCTALSCLLRAALMCPIRAPRACAVLDCWCHVSHGNGRLLNACFRVFARCAKKKLSTLSLRSAVENGSVPPKNALCFGISKSPWQDSLFLHKSKKPFLGTNGVVAYVTESHKLICFDIELSRPGLVCGADSPS